MNKDSVVPFWLKFSLILFTSGSWRRLTRMFPLFFSMAVQTDIKWDVSHSLTIIQNGLNQKRCVLTKHDDL